jgi:hypothetical protein
VAARKAAKNRKCSTSTQTVCGFFHRFLLHALVAWLQSRKLTPGEPLDAEPSLTPGTGCVNCFSCIFCIVFRAASNFDIYFRTFTSLAVCVVSVHQQFLSVLSTSTGHVSKPSLRCIRCNKLTVLTVLAVMSLTVMPVFDCCVFYVRCRAHSSLKGLLTVLAAMC